MEIKEFNGKRKTQKVIEIRSNIKNLLFSLKIDHESFH